MYYLQQCHPQTTTSPATPLLPSQPCPFRYEIISIHSPADRLFSLCVPVPVPTPPAELLNLAGSRHQTHQQQQQQQRSGELWLRAATIAVPIAGLFILAGLVLLAIRMLRRESKPQYQYAKAPLFQEPALARSPTGAAVRAPAGAGAGAGAAGVVPAVHHTTVPVHCVVSGTDWQGDT